MQGPEAGKSTVGLRLREETGVSRVSECGEYGSHEGVGASVARMEKPELGGPRKEFSGHKFLGSALRGASSE